MQFPRITISLCTVAVALATVAVPAHAQPGMTFEAPPAPTTSDDGELRIERYGAHVLALDLAVIAVGAAAENGDIVIGGYLLSGPLIHIAHGEGGRAMGSLALRLTVPASFAMAGFAIGEANCGEDDWFCGLGEAALGLALGAVLTTAIDASVLAKKTYRVEQRSVFNYRGVSANPNVGVRRSGGLTFGLNGSF